jgi:hypothetical protein
MKSGLELFMSLRGGEAGRERPMDCRWTLGEGNALEQLLAAEVMLAAHRGQLVRSSRVPMANRSPG